LIAPAAKHYFLFGFLLTIHLSLQGRKLTTLLERQSVYPKKVSELLAQLLTKTQVDKLPEATKPLEQVAEQAGKPKEKRFSPPKICLPSLYLPRLPPALLWIPVVLVALWAMWYSLDTAWNAIRPLFG
jgi:hypothetical protein